MEHQGGKVGVGARRALKLRNETFSSCGGKRGKHTHTHTHMMGSPGGTSGKEPICQGRRQETWVQSRGQEDPLEEGMATHSRILAWRIPWAEEPGRLQSIESQRVG